LELVKKNVFINLYFVAIRELQHGNHVSTQSSWIHGLVS